MSVSWKTGAGIVLAVAWVYTFVLATKANGAQTAPPNGGQEVTCMKSPWSSNEFLVSAFQAEHPHRKMDFTFDSSGHDKICIVHSPVP